jgi:N utilization substance protein B
MPSRRKSRQRALQILFLWEARGQTVEEAMDSYYDAIFPEDPPERDSFAAELVRGAVSHLPDLDMLITKHAAHWRLERMPAVDRNIIRLAVYEMTSAGTPAAIAIDEALELARKFSGEDSVQFVNGVLDAIHRELSPPPEPMTDQKS